MQAALKLLLEPIFEADFPPVLLRVPPEAWPAGSERLRRKPVSLDEPASVLARLGDQLHGGSFAAN